MIRYDVRSPRADDFINRNRQAIAQHIDRGGHFAHVKIHADVQHFTRLDGFF